MAHPQQAARRQPVEARVLVYNPSIFPDDVQVFGHYFHFPPRGVGQCLCAHHQPSRPGGQTGDNQGVHAIYEWPRNEKNIMIRGGRREVVADAQRVADFIVSEECRGKKGFVILSGGAEDIATQKAEADANFVAFYMPLCEEVIANWEASVSDYRKNRPGDAAPRQPAVVKKAYDFRDIYGDAMPSNTIRRKPWICNICGNEEDNEQVLIAVCAKRHPAQSNYTNISQPADASRVIEAERRFGTPAPRPPAPAPHSGGPLESEDQMRARLGLGSEDDPYKDDAASGEQGDTDLDLTPGLDHGVTPLNAPPPQPDAPGGAPRTAGGSTVPAGVLAAQARQAQKVEAVKAAADLLERAGKAVVNLTVADRKGLQHGDADVIGDVRERVEAAEKKKGKKAPPAPAAEKAPDGEKS